MTDSSDSEYTEPLGSSPRPHSSSLPTFRNACESLKKDEPVRARRRVAKELLRDGLPYSKKLVGHTSCVNALAFSKDGRWLASAGDDPYVQIWDFHQEELSQPKCRFSGPRSNVFALAFSASGQFVYSGDTRDVIYQYDISHLDDPVARAQHGSGSPSWSDIQHNDSIRAISCHPEQDSLFLSAAEDGCVILHDMRANPRYTRAQSILQHNAEFTCVQYHPAMTNIFATSDNRGHVCLRDVRMAFGPPSQRAHQGVVHKYVTTVAKQGGVTRMARPEASSLVFDSEGRRLGVTMLHHLPTLYTLNDPYPIATFSGRYQPDGRPVPPGDKAYSNSCTMKHGSFGTLGSDKDMYFAQGSDDFRTYVWAIPDESALMKDRKVIEYSQWAQCERPGEIGYASSLLGTRHVPVDVSVPVARLTGHESIVNTALIHPYHPYILTAGIERYIRLHSPTSATLCTEPLDLTPKDVRTVPASSLSSHTLFLRAMGMMDDYDDVDDDDGEAIALFDQILRQESDGDVFAIRPWEPDSDEIGTSDEDMDLNSDDGDSSAGMPL